MVREAAIKSFASFSPTACILSRLPYHFYVFSNPALPDILNSTKPHPLLFLIVASPIPTIASTIPVPLGCLPYRKRYGSVFGEIFKPRGFLPLCNDIHRVLLRGERRNRRMKLKAPKSIEPV